MLAKKAAGGGGPSAPGSKEIPVGEENCLTGLTFVFTGELSSISRDDAQNLVKRYGGRVTGAVSGKTSYLVAGEDSGESKLSKAKSVKVKIIDEDGFLDVIASSKGKPSSGSSTPSAKAGKKAVGTDVKENKLKESTSSMSSELWTTKYKPTRYEDVLGNKKNVEKLAIWLKGWSASTVTAKPSSAKDDPGKSRAILISGPPGIGKTTAAHLVAKLEGFEIVEFNASDTRSKKAVGEMTGSHTLAEYFIRDSKSVCLFTPPSHPRTARQVLIMDEVDGMSAGDRGGVAELINVIKNTKVPIICICNDRQSPKVKSLVNHCFDMRFARPRTTEIEKAIKVIAAKEGLDIKINAMEAMVQSTHADIRQILNMLSTYALQSSELSFDQSRALSKSSEKNMTMSPWDVTGTLFNRVSFRETSFADKLELYFSDFSLIPLMIQENYIKMDPVLAKENGGPNKAQQDIEALNLLSNAADAIAHADIISSVQMKTQNWGLLPFHGVTSTLRPAFFTHGSLVNTGSFYGGGYAFPSWLGKNSNQSKNVRLLKEIQLHMRLHVSADKNEVRQSYLPALAPLITLPLAKDSSGVEQVIQTMDDYYLTREDWDSILDLGLDECSAKALTADIPTATKTAFTRTYNKANHPKPFMTASLLSKSRGGGGGMSGVPDLEEAFENDDEGAGVGDDEDGAGEDADEDDVGADRLIKKKEKAAPRKSAASGSGAKGGKRGADAGAKASASKKVKK
ncbi:replication factor RFC1 C terminal domain-containing protein [Chytriomyces cf. hyalinus JEL632]|nr:replication factor RFC1 C terminal domain-containing protein [Chytriomyces cf. hyalinus JEL632]